MKRLTRQQIKKQALDNDRYGANYRSVCHASHKATGNICCHCMVAKSEEVHHAMYRDRYGKIREREIPGFHVFPLCNTCHGIAHLKINWRRFKDHSYNKNTVVYWDMLKRNFKKLNKRKTRR